MDLQVLCFQVRSIQTGASVSFEATGRLQLLPLLLCEDYSWTKRMLYAQLEASRVSKLPVSTTMGVLVHKDICRTTLRKAFWHSRRHNNYYWKLYLLHNMFLANHVLSHLDYQRLVPSQNGCPPPPPPTPPHTHPHHPQQHTTQHTQPNPTNNTKPTHTTTQQQKRLDT